MSSKGKLLTLDDLITALITDANFRDAAEPLAIYHKNTLAILKQLFECDLQERGAELDQEARRNKRRRGSDLVEEYYEVSGQQTIMFLENCIKAVVRLNRPFGSLSILRVCLLKSSGNWRKSTERTSALTNAS